MSEIDGREDHEGLWHAVTDDESRPTDLTAVCGMEIPVGARSGTWGDLDESAETWEDCHDLLEGEHRERGFTIENNGDVPAIRSRVEPPWLWIRAGMVRARSGPLGMWTMDGLVRVVVAIAPVSRPRPCSCLRGSR